MKNLDHSFVGPSDMPGSSATGSSSGGSPTPTGSVGAGSDLVSVATLPASRDSSASAIWSLAGRSGFCDESEIGGNNSVDDAILSLID
ncbi:hypothetical protein IID10_22365 [candidate division KSB1 bacterium]|nr:hypothetical protein [candidate division KSB1 bacterium]